jgi:molybdenum cofactor cytidylyltransferase
VQTEVWTVQIKVWTPRTKVQTVPTEVWTVPAAVRSDRTSVWDTWVRMAHVSVAILPAAGASRRMGKPKLMLPIGGQPMVAGVVEALRAGGAGEIVLVTAPGDAELRAWAVATGVSAAVNPQPERGMLSTIQAGIAALGGSAELAGREEILLVSPADLPGLHPATVAALLRRMAETGAPIAVPVHHDRHGHPLAIAPRLIPEIDTLDPAVGLRQLRDRHAAELLEVEVEDPGAVLDVDTPEDYARLSGPP